MPDRTGPVIGASWFTNVASAGDLATGGNQGVLATDHRISVVDLEPDHEPDLELDVLRPNGGRAPGATRGTFQTPGGNEDRDTGHPVEPHTTFLPGPVPPMTWDRLFSGCVESPARTGEDP